MDWACCGTLPTALGKRVTRARGLPERWIPPLLRENANFRRFFIGQAVSLLGDQVSAIALPLTAVLALHANAGQMGALTTAFLIPNLLFSLQAGAWVDRRGGRREVMLAADVGRALLIGTIPLAYALGHLTWMQLYLVAFLSGSLSVVFGVAYGGFFQVLVPRDQDVEGNSLWHGSRAFSFLAGNSIGGILVQLLRGPYALGLDALSYLWSALFFARIGVEEPPGAPREPADLPLCRRVRVGRRPDAARHHGRDDQRQHRADAAPLACLRCVHARQLRRAPTRDCCGRRAGLNARRTSHLWIATVGALAGLLWLIPSPIPRLRELPEQAAL